MKLRVLGRLRMIVAWERLSKPIPTKRFAGDIVSEMIKTSG